MSFDVFLIESAASPPKPQFERTVEAALRSVGAKKPPGDGVAQLPGGSEFELFGGGMFALREISPSICKAVFVAALKTNSYIVPADDDGFAFVPSGSAAKPPKNFMPIRVVASPAVLCSSIEKGFRAWRGYADQVRNRPIP